MWIGQQEEETHVDQHARQPDHGEAGESRRQGREAQPHQVAEVIKVQPGGDLALAGGALAEHVTGFGDRADPAAAQDLEQDLVPERAHLRLGDGGTAHHEVPAHRVGHASDHRREHGESE